MFLKTYLFVIFSASVVIILKIQPTYCYALVNIYSTNNLAHQIPTNS